MRNSLFEKVKVHWIGTKDPPQILKWSNGNRCALVSKDYGHKLNYESWAGKSPSRHHRNIGDSRHHGDIKYISLGDNSSNIKHSMTPRNLRGSSSRPPIMPRGSSFSDSWCDFFQSGNWGLNYAAHRTGIFLFGFHLSASWAFNWGPSIRHPVHYCHDDQGVSRGLSVRPLRYSETPASRADRCRNSPKYCHFIYGIA